MIVLAYLTNRKRERNLFSISSQTQPCLNAGPTLLVGSTLSQRRANIRMLSGRPSCIILAAVVRAAEINSLYYRTCLNTYHKHDQSAILTYLCEDRSEVIIAY